MTTIREKNEFPIINQIADRAHRKFTEMGISRKKLDWLMDIEAAHRARPLRLEELRDADDFNFLHDVGGIMNHLNRETGQIEDFFVPRFSA